MFSHKCFLKLGDFSGNSLTSLLKDGYELVNCEFSFHQGVDDFGNASTMVYGGMISATLSSLPTKEIIEWALSSRKYKKGILVVLDDQEGAPIEKIMFDNAACIHMDIDYTLKGESYINTKLVIQTESLVFDNGVDFDNAWVK